MKNVLFLTAYYPPILTGATQRHVRFVRHLPSFGWRPFVFAPDRFPLLPSDALSVESGEHSVVERFAPSLLPFGLVNRPVVYLGLNKVLAPDFFISAIPSLLWAIRKKLKERIDVIYTSCGPFSLLLAGAILRKYMYIPWVVDFRDPWSVSPHFDNMTFMHKWVNERIENMSMNRCDYLVMNTPEVLQKQIQKYPIVQSKATCIPNGFDPSEFSTVAPSRRKDKKWTFLYVGSWYRKIYSDALFRVIKEFFLRHTDLSFEVKYAGQHFQHFQNSAKKCGLESRLRNLGQLSHGQTLTEMCVADVLLFTNPSQSPPYWVPSKLYEYVGSGKPILGSSTGEGLAFRVAQAAGGRVVLEDDQGKISAGIDYLESLLGDDQAKSVVRQRDENVIKDIQHPLLTGKLAGIFDAVVENKGDQT